MNATERILTVTTVSFVASTLYFAWALGVERDRSVDLQITRAAAAGSTGSAAVSATDAENSDGSTEAAPAKSPGLLDGLGEFVGGGKKRPSPDQQNALFQADFKRMYLDPVSRKQLIEERIPRFRDDYVVLERRLDMPADQWQRFLETLAGLSVEQGASSAVCAGDTRCMMQKIGPETYARFEQEIRDLLGNADIEEYQTFRYALTERQSIEALQAKLPLSQQLGEKTAEDLIAALSEVRRAAEKSIASEKGSFQAFSGVGYSVVFPPDVKTFEERLNLTARHFRKLHERAKSFLNPVQMAAYEAQMAETLRTLKRTMATTPGFH